MFSIAPIGSCRIATPLRLAKKDYGFTVDHSRNYGFCHTTAEAVQLMRFMRGDLLPPAKVWPMIARGVDRDAMLAEAPPKADMYVVEISSAKRLMVGDTCIQLNYFANEYRAFFDNKARVAHFWAMGRTEDQAKIDAFLAEAWGATVEQQQESAILRQVRMTLTTEDEMRADIRTLITELPAVLFITHVDARKPNGDTIASRSSFIEAVARVVREEGGTHYNPTARMIEVGQEAAIEDFSDSLAHFTEEFSKIVFADWFDLAIGPVMDRCIARGGAPAVADILHPHVDAMRSKGNLDDLDARLTRLSDQMDRNLDLTLMRTRIAFGRGEPEAAYDIATQAAHSFPDQPAVLRLLGEAALATGRLSETAVAYRRLIALNHPPAATEILSLADALRAQGKTGSAIAFFDIALRIKPDLAAAAQGMVALAVTDAPDHLTSLPPTRRDQIAALLPPLLHLQLAVATGADLDPIRTRIAAAPTAELVAMLDYLTSADHVDLAADLLQRWSTQHDGLNVIDRDLRAVVDGWFARVATTPGFAAQIRLLRMILTAHPLHGPSRTALRTLRRDIVTQVRDLYRDQNLPALNALSAEVADLPEPIPELDLFRARLSFGQGDYDGARALGQSAAVHLVDSISIWSLLMRCATKLGDLLAIDHAARKVIDLSDADTERLEHEARDRLERLPALCFRAAETEPDPLTQYRLLSIARRDPKLCETCDNRLMRLSATLLNTLRTLEVDQSRDFLPLAEALVETLGESDRLLTSIGRYLVKQKDFARALPYWQRLVDLAPDNPDHAFQRNRCQDRIRGADLRPVPQPKAAPVAVTA